MRWVSEKHNWHRWFAWHPVFLVHQTTGQEMTVWWEHVARKQIQGHYFPYYIYKLDPDFKGDK